jgi:hypothetical protein
MLHVTQRELCEAAGIPWAMLSAIEHDWLVPQQPSCDELAHMAQGIAMERIDRAIAEIEEMEREPIAAN